MTKAIVVILNAKDTPLIGNLDTIEAVLWPHMLYSMDEVKHDTWQATILCWRFKYQAKQFQLYFVVPYHQQYGFSVVSKYNYTSPETKYNLLFSIKANFPEQHLSFIKIKSFK